MPPISLSYEAAEAILSFFDKVVDAKYQLGAPGDFGYSTREGKAIYSLAQAIVDAHPVIVTIKSCIAAHNPNRT